MGSVFARRLAGETQRACFVNHASASTELPRFKAQQSKSLNMRRQDEITAGETPSFAVPGLNSFVWCRLDHVVHRARRNGRGRVGEGLPQHRINSSSSRKVNNTCPSYSQGRPGKRDGTTCLYISEGGGHASSVHPLPSVLKEDRSIVSHVALLWSTDQYLHPSREGGGNRVLSCREGGGKRRRLRLLI